MDNYDLRGEGYGNQGTLSVLEYQGKKGQMSKHFSNNLYVKNFSTDDSFDDEKLSKLFSSFGTVISACVMRDSEGRSRGFGFVCFEDSASAEKAAKAIHDYNMDADKNDPEAPSYSSLYVREAKKKSQRKQELLMNNFKYKKSIMFFSLFVKNFPPGTTEEELKIYFSSACQGEVTKV